VPDQVRSMFDRIAGVYDLMNTAMTAGLHHRWRARAADAARVGPGSRVLDVATGTGDLALELATRVWPGGEVIGCDFAEAMLERARAKARAAVAGARDGVRVRPDFEWADALGLPYDDASFDAATVGFGARNFAGLGAGLAEMTRVVRPGGRVVVLEITTPRRPPLSLFYRLWFDALVPALGRAAQSLSGRATSAGPPRLAGAWTGAEASRGPGAWTGAAPLTGAGAWTGAGASSAPDASTAAAAPAPTVAQAYAYLPSSVRRFPGPYELAAEMARAGLEDVGYVLLAGGIIAIHSGTASGGRR
jgi:demethylmenaquinone methyltransferase / 2-methoxy-6-polyprenyl-1,4-benzoquinol methylase